MTETFLYSFLVPILKYMLEERLHNDPSYTQPLTSALLIVHGIFILVSAPVIAHFSDKAPDRKTALLAVLGGAIVGTLTIAVAPSRMFFFFLNEITAILII